MLKNLYNWTLAQAAKPAAVWWLAFVSAIESIFFPIPQDVMMIPMMLADRKRAFVIATYALVGSIFGAAIGFVIGWGFYELIGKPIIATLGYIDKAEALRLSLVENAWWIILTGGITPVPFKLIVLISGWAKVNFFMFMALALFGRALRFYAFALAFYLFGETIKSLIDRYFNALAVAFVVIFVGGFIAIRYLV